MCGFAQRHYQPDYNHRCGRSPLTSPVTVITALLTMRFAVVAPLSDALSPCLRAGGLASPAIYGFCIGEISKTTPMENRGNDATLFRHFSPSDDRVEARLLSSEITNRCCLSLLQRYSRRTETVSVNFINENAQTIANFVSKNFPWNLQLLALSVGDM